MVERAVVAKLATGIKPYLTRRRLYSDAVALCLLGVAAEETVQDPVAAAVRRGDEEGEVDGRMPLGVVAGKQGRWADQDREFERVLEVMRQDVHPSVRHYNLQQIAISYREDGRLEKALAVSEECHRAAIDFGNEFAIAEALEELGRTQLARGELEVAERHLRAALESVEGNWQPEALVRYGAPQVDEVRALLAAVSG